MRFRHRFISFQQKCIDYLIDYILIATIKSLITIEELHSINLKENVTK